LSRLEKSNSKKKSPKIRLDKFLIEKSFASNENEARALILSGKVFCENACLDKVGFLVHIDSSDIFVRDKKGHSWVSRGGMKLDHAIKYFEVDIKDFVAIDVGASTGGFCDVMLANNVAKIFAVDVGYGELAWKIQSDERVVILDRTNARNLTEQQITEKVDLIVCDASFINLEKVLPKAMSFAKDDAILIALIKPQFEAAKKYVDAGNGIITDSSVHEQVCENVKYWLEDEMNWQVIGLTESPILGAEGNKEFLIIAKKS